MSFGVGVFFFFPRDTFAICFLVLAGTVIGALWRGAFVAQSYSKISLLKNQPPLAIHTGAQVAKAFLVLGLIDSASRYWKGPVPPQGQQSKSHQ
jgi:hypothetical protein